MIRSSVLRRRQLAILERAAVVQRQRATAATEGHRTRLYAYQHRLMQVYERIDSKRRWHEQAEFEHESGQVRLFA